MNKIIFILFKIFQVIWLTSYFTKLDVLKLLRPKRSNYMDYN